MPIDSGGDARALESFETQFGEKEARSQGRIPEGLELYQDHFPDFPVLPGVLALDLLNRMVLRFLEERMPERQYALEAASAVKFSAWLRPGDEWQSEAVFEKEESGKQVWKGRILKEGRAAVSARLVFRQLK